VLRIIPMALNSIEPAQFERHTNNTESHFLHDACYSLPSCSMPARIFYCHVRRFTYLAGVD
jgi:hypothetical protein